MPKKIRNDSIYKKPKTIKIQDIKKISKPFLLKKKMNTKHFINFH